MASSFVLVLAAFGVGASPAAASAASPHWQILTQSQPTFFKAGDTSDAYVLVIRNDGGMATAKASTVTVTDTLPAKVTATKVTARGEAANGNGLPRYEMTCSQMPVTGSVTCTYEEGPLQGRILPGATIVVTITVSIPQGLAVRELESSATVSGGGAPPASAEEATRVDAEPVPFGLSFFDVDTVAEDGEAATQAGSHPFELTTSLAFDVSSRETPSAGNGGAESPLASAAPKDVEVALPPGLVGDPNGLPKCSQRAFLEREELNCPLDTQVGTVKPFFYGTFASAVFPVFNIVPPPGQPAELGFSVAGIGHIPLFFHVRSDSDYGLTAELNEIPETGPLQAAILTLWGVPAEASHDLEREGTLGEDGQQSGEICKPEVQVEGGVEKQTRCPSDAPARPFLTLPSSCGGELPVSVRRDSWQNPEQLSLVEPEPAGAFHPELNLPPITGCEHLSFTPSLTLAPETTQAGAPSGYTVAVRVPQNESPTALATPDLRNATVSLPAGVVLSPSVASGLQACSPAQFALHSLTAATCPPQAQIGTVKIATPLVSSPLEGEVFVGQPECALCTSSDAQDGRLLRLLVQAQGSGVIVKLEGATSIDQSTGQLTARFRELPQLPWEQLQLNLNGGPRAPLANTSACGVPLAASSWLTPYSSESAAQPTSEPFALSGCATPQFHPSFVAGTTANEAGQPSALTVTLSRSDADADFEGVSVHLPPGLLGMLSTVQPCSQAQARAGACGPQSEIGSATVGAGPGADPLFLEGGHVYLTGPYEGAPFGLSIVVPAVAGPFNLGAIVVGARIEVSPTTAALTIVSDPLPQSLDGIPLQIKTVNLDIAGNGFIVNPTSCQPSAIEATLTSSDGATAPVSSRFQAADCARLAFQPKLTALTHARTSKADGAYLHVRLVTESGQANIAKVKVDLPSQLPSRLSTLQRACVAAVLEANPAACPAASRVGTATVISPVLHAPLAGPAYLVSHGGSASPDLELVLQGEGVTIDVVGHTTIKRGVIAAAFEALPDVPISSFDLVLDEGAHSLLAADLPAKARHSMCGQRLTMPVELIAQNGAVIKRTPTIAVWRCTSHTPRRKPRHRVRGHARHAARGKARHQAHGKPSRKA
ncbi:MAG TPA: hypothetical protein VK721_04125 [Solirubrobacteraceae bacterium]|nr:hypothetical protein [Solirubrobacteraceae bacterium]